MKQYTGKTNTGKAFRGIYTTSGMPNQKPKRIRKIDKQEEIDAIWNGATTHFSINMMGISELLFQLHQPRLAQVGKLVWRLCFLLLLFMWR